MKIVIPIYTTQLNDYEQYSLRQSIKMFAPRRDIVIVSPASLDLSPLKDVSGNVGVERFDDDFFASIKDYNRLMLSAEFYARFIDSEYIVICQTDVLVLSDTLDEWCNKGYDYVGAPWLPKHKYLHYPQRLVWHLRRMMAKLPSSKDHGIVREGMVGNGGFSLRRTKSLHNVCLQLHNLMEVYRENGNNVKLFEDVFWATQAQLNIPPYQEAVYFAMETRPDCALRLTHGQLPMAIHAWCKPPYLDFWKHKLILPNSMCQ